MANTLANCWRQIELVSILANFFTNFFVLVNSYLTCERLANVSCQHSTFLPTVVVSFTHANLSLPTLVCCVKAALKCAQIYKFIIYSKALFSVSCVKPKPKKSLWQITTGADSPANEPIKSRSKFMKPAQSARETLAH